jgi:hemolysin activation/secretion protein
MFGPYPYFDAAAIGGTNTVRLGRENRYAGDASVYANAELRLALARQVLGSSFDVGVFGLADVGRVYLEGESSDKWHSAAGGGAWVSVLEPVNTLSIAWARSEQRTAFYLMIGFGI